MISTIRECGIVVWSGRGSRDGGAGESAFSQIFHVFVPGSRLVEQSIERMAALVRRAARVDVAWRRMTR
jgi:hypothetical protein